MERNRADSSGTPPPRRVRWGVVVAVLVVLALAAQGIWSRRDAQAALEREAVHASQLSVEVVHPQKSSAGLDLVLPGNVQAFLDTPVYARTNGYSRSGTRTLART